MNSIMIYRKEKMVITKDSMHNVIAIFEKLPGHTIKKIVIELEYEDEIIYKDHDELLENLSSRY